MSPTFLKEIRRSIVGAPGRFIALIVIVAIGCGFFAGLRMCGIGMRKSADAFLEQQQTYDLELMSDKGVGSQELDALRAIDGVDGVAGQRSADVVASFGTERYACRVEQLPQGQRGATGAEDGMAINQLQLESGRWPQAPNECVVLQNVVDKLEQTDSIEVLYGATSLDGLLEQKDYTVVGTVSAPTYLSSTYLAPTTLGSGTVQQVLFVQRAAFAQDAPYTGALISVAGTVNYMQNEGDYNQQIAQVSNAIDQQLISFEDTRLEELKATAQDELAQNEDDFATRKAQTLQQLDDAKAQLDSSKRELDALRAQLDEKQRKLDQKKRELEDGQAQLDEGRVQLQVAKQRLQQAKDDLQRAIDAGILTPEQIAQIQAQIAAEEAIIQTTQEKLDVKQQEISAGRRQLEEGQAQIDEGLKQWQNGYNQYLEAKRTYDASRATALAQLDEAQKKIDDAQDEIHDLKRPIFYKLDRTKNAGIAAYLSDSKRIDSIATAFPFFFFVVAALVALTTMTRMVEDDRELIGTHKALGFGAATISSRYLLYALFASVIGCIVGITIFSQVLPLVIFNSYGIAYNVPARPLPLPIEWNQAIYAAVLGIGVTVIATLCACIASLREVPANLMRARAPKVGKRILLEHIKFIWSHTNFTWKVTFRNMFRYKKRLFMTLVGIAGSTALLLTGFGVRDSINGIIDKQFGEVFHFNATIGLLNNVPSGDLENITDYIKSNAGIAPEDTHLVELYQENMLVEDGSATTSLQVITPLDNSAFADVLTLRNRTENRAIIFDNSSVVISEKIAATLNKGIGNTIDVFYQDDAGNITNNKITVTITDICENYVANYLYLGKDTYEAAKGKHLPQANLIWAQTSDEDLAEDNLAKGLEEKSGVNTVIFNTETIAMYRSLLRAMDSVMGILVGSAAILAFVVLYNLTNINIAERKREIATLKVLGFTFREVRKYIFREIFMLVVLGTLLGLVVGVWFEGYVIQTAEIDKVMFVREIQSMAFFMSFALTLLFGVLVMIFMQHKLRQVDMVESLKAGE